MPLVCVMRADQARPNLRSYLAGLRESGAPLMYATSGHGSTSHFMGAYIAKRHQLASVHVPFAGSLPTVTAVLGGHVPFAIVDPMLVIEHLSNGDLHCLAISSSSREPRLPMTETLSEQGLSAVEFTSWQGLLLPSATPAPIKASSTDLFLNLTKSEQVKKVLHEAFIQSVPLTGARAETFFHNDHRVFQALMSDLQIAIQ
jgi:tripartite-type tricarboxylate transporter receptor subunit TctC